MKLNPRLLIVDNNASFLEQLKQQLVDRYDLVTASDVAHANELLTNGPFDLVLAEYFLENETALGILRFIRGEKKPPTFIIMSDRIDKNLAIKCLNEGSDGIIEKPFTEQELVNLLNSKISNPELVEDINFSPVDRTVKIGAQLFQLTEIEFQILSYFYHRHDSWVQRRELVKHLWGDGVVSRNILDTHLVNLKSKIPGLQNAVQNIRGKGYRLDVEKLRLTPQSH